MNSLIGQVFKFLWVAVWGKINIGQLLALNKHYVILTASNIILSLLFIYMVEQTTVRTEQYRTLKQEILQIEQRAGSLEKINLGLEERLVVQRRAFGLIEVQVDPNIMVKEYNDWVNEVKRLDNAVTLPPAK